MELHELYLLRVACTRDSNKCCKCSLQSKRLLRVASQGCAFSFPYLNGKTIECVEHERNPRRRGDCACAS